MDNGAEEAISAPVISINRLLIYLYPPLGQVSDSRPEEGSGTSTDCDAVDDHLRLVVPASVTGLAQSRHQKESKSRKRGSADRAPDDCALLRIVALLPHLLDCIVPDGRLRSRAHTEHERIGADARESAANGLTLCSHA